MEVSKRFFPKILLDNEEAYFKHLCGAIEAIDELCCMEITRTTHNYSFRISPSIFKYSQPLLREILKINTIYGINLELSKSMRTNGVVSFSIELTNNN